MHQNHEGLGVLILHDEGFHNLVVVNAQLAAGFRGAAVLHIVVAHFNKIHIVFFEPLGGGRCAFVFGFTHDQCAAAVFSPAAEKRFSAIMPRRRVRAV